MWRAMGWSCNEGSNAVIDTLKKVFKWRSTKWWHSLQAEMMQRDPENHTRWKHKWRWHNRGNVWDKMATDWTRKEDGVRERDVKSTRVDMYKFVTFALDSVKLSTAHRKRKDPRMPLQYNCVETVMLRANGSMVNILWCRSTEEELAKCKTPYTRGGKRSLRKIGDLVKHVFQEHNREADLRANIGAEGQKIVIDICNNSETWKAVKGDWDGSVKENW